MLCRACLGIVVLAAAFTPGPRAVSTVPATLADQFGTTGNKFAGAIGLVNREANSSPEARAGYGLGLDDVVVEWREFTFEEDASDCGGGRCAVINLATNNVFEGRTLIGITVVDASPDAPVDLDCDDDGVPDVVVIVVTLDAAVLGGDKVVGLAWSTLATVDAIRGDLRALRADGGLGTSEDATPTPARRRPVLAAAQRGSLQRAARRRIVRRDGGARITRRRVLDRRGLRRLKGDISREAIAE